MNILWAYMYSKMGEREMWWDTSSSVIISDVKRASARRERWFGITLDIPSHIPPDHITITFAVPAWGSIRRNSSVWVGFLLPSLYGRALIDLGFGPGSFDHNLEVYPLDYGQCEWCALIWMNIVYIEEGHRSQGRSQHNSGFHLLSVRAWVVLVF